VTTPVTQCYISSAEFSRRCSRESSQTTASRLLSDLTDALQRTTAQLASNNGQLEASVMDKINE